MTLPEGIQIAWREVPPGLPRRRVSRALLAELLPGAVFVSRCASCGGDHGRVRVRGVDAAASVSYVEGWAVVVAATGHARVGIDAVTLGAAGLERVIPGEADARAWSRVEAVLKADGRGLAVDPARVEVRPADDGWWARIDDAEGGPWRGWDAPAPAGVAVAVAVPSPDSETSTPDA